MEKKLTIQEIFYSIQGESYLAGLPCVFVRLTGCHQRCVYCDTEYAFYGGEKMTVEEIDHRVKKFSCKNLLITGGEPLLQSNTPHLAAHFLKQGFRVAIETSGSLPIETLPKGVIRIMDLKTPGSGECDKNRYENLRHLDRSDEVKFVITNSDDMDWALATIREYRLCDLCHVSMSPIQAQLLPLMADRVLAAAMPVRVQHQLHKFIWPNKERGF